MISSEDRNMIARTIFDQMVGAEGKGYQRLRVMLGDDLYLETRDGLHGAMIKFKGCKKWNWCRVLLMPNDYYRVTFGKVRLGKGRIIFEESEPMEGVEANDLSGMFEAETGLRTSL